MMKHLRIPVGDQEYCHFQPAGHRAGLPLAEWGLHLTIGLYDGDRQIKSQTWKAKIGHDNFASSMLMIGSATSKSRDLEAELTPQELADLFAEGHAPTIKVLVAIDND
jgi:hypothetical protein